MSRASMRTAAAVLLVGFLTSGFPVARLAAETPAMAAHPTTRPTTHPTIQLAIPRVELMPDAPPDFKPFDFHAVAVGFDKLVFDADATGKYRPLIWWDDSKTNMPTRGLGMPTYLGHPEMKGGDHHEAINVLGTLVGATLAGVDKSKGEHDYVAMAPQYFNSANGLNVVLNHSSTSTGQTYWYELFPQILFDVLANRYPDHPRLAEISDIAARRWLGAYDALAKDGAPKFEQTAFDLAKMVPVDNGKWHEPDAAAGFAQIFYAAFLRTNDAAFLDAAKGCIRAIEARGTNPSYEILMPFGAYAAARMNAEQGSEFDVGALVGDFFDPTSDVRPNWGLIVGNWNGYEASGMIGSTTDAGGYGFVMNTYAGAIGIVPIARYDERYARSIAKWVLNASNAIRYCYPGQLPVEKTSDPQFASDPPNVIAFEGIRHRLKGKSPYAGGDPTVYGWGPCDLGLYGSGFSGVFGGTIRPTSDPLILQLDLLAADPCPPKAFPTHLYFNPRAGASTVKIDVGTTSVDLYDSIENKVIATNKHGETELTIPGNATRMIVRVPAGSAIAQEGRRSSVGGVVIDYENGLLPPREVKTKPIPPSKARVIPIAKATIAVDGKVDDWKNVASQPLTLDTGGRGTLRADVSFAWDADYLYVLVRETARGAESHEAASGAALAATPWDFDVVGLSVDLANSRRQKLSDFIVLFGLTSDGTRDVAFSSQAPDDGSAQIVAATAGSKTDGTRVVEGRIAWRGMAAATFGPAGRVDVAPGFTFGCEPMLAEKNHTKQSHIGGGQYVTPTGNDANSIDLVLQP